MARMSTVALITTTTTLALVTLLVSSETLVAYAWNPFEFLFKKSEEQRKQEIYKALDAYENERYWEYRKNNTPVWPLELSVVELTDRIYELERLENLEYDESQIRFEANNNLFEEINGR